MHYKVIIIGAGPAGISAALNLQKRGVNCCLVDKAIFPRHKLCGGLITEKTIRLLEHFGIDDFDTVVKQRVNTVDIKDNGKLVARLHTQRFFSIVDRFTFDNWLLNKYIEKGGNALLGEKVIHLDLDKKEITTNKNKISFEYVIGADGAKGITAKSLKRKPLAYAFGMEAEVDTSAVNEDKNSITLDVGIAKDGYAWRFPRDNKTLFGFAFTYDKNFDYKAYATSIFPKDAITKGAFLPYGGKISVVSDERGLLAVGDAAGFVDAITGEGIYYALKSGALAAKAITSSNIIKSYQSSTKNIIKEVNASWKLISKFYTFRKQILKMLPSHIKFVEFICDEQVSVQNCDFSIFKILKAYRRKKIKN